MSATKDKQERKVVHLQIGERHEYFGSIEQLFCKYSKEQLGFRQVCEEPQTAGSDSAEEGAEADGGLRYV